MATNDYDVELMKGLYNPTLEVTKSPSGTHSDDNGEAGEIGAYHGYGGTVSGGAQALATSNSHKQEQTFLAVFNDFQSHDILDGPSRTSPPSYQSNVSGGNYVFTGMGTSPFDTLVPSTDVVGAPGGRSDSLADTRTYAGATAQHSSAGDSSSNAPCLYASIATSSLQGRRLDFRAFLTKKAMPAEIMREGQAGVFVGQLPSTYTEDDTAALLRAIGDDAGVAVHVRDVKSHNQSRTCAFVTVNQGALQVLLGYSKRVLCDSTCVWVVEREKASLLKEFVDGLVRERLRGVPKAALVLEQLTPQYVRSQTGGGNKEWRGSGPPAREVVGTVDGLFMPMTAMVASSGSQPQPPPPPPPPPSATVSEGHIVGSGTHMPMSVFVPSWGGVQQTTGRRPTGALSGAQVVSTFPGANVYGGGGACFIAVPPPGTVPNRPQQQVNLCIVSPGTGAMQPMPYVGNYAGGNMYAQATTASPGAMPMHQAGGPVSPVQVGMTNFGQQVAGGSTVYLQSVPSYALHQVLQHPQQQ